MRTVFYEWEYIFNAHLKTNESLLQVFPDQRPHKSKLESWLTSSCHFQSLRPSPHHRVIFFSSLFPVFPTSSSPVSACTARRCGSEKKKKDGINERGCLYLNAKKMTEEGAGRIQISAWSLVENQNKITCCRNISRLTQHHLLPFSLHTSPNHLLFLPRACARPANLVSPPITRVFSLRLRRRWWAAAKPSIPHTAWVRAEREDTFARPHSSDPSARRKVSPRAQVLASMRVEEQKRKSRRGKRAAAANLNQRFPFQSLLFGGTTDKFIITRNQSERGGLWMS